MQIPVHRGSGEPRKTVVRAPTTEEEQKFFEELKKNLDAPTMADLLRYCCAKTAKKNGLKIPRSWERHYSSKSGKIKKS